MAKLIRSIVVVGVLAAASTFAGACAERDAPDCQARINDDLSSGKLDDVRADWKADEKTLHLRGEVERAADKARAEELAKQVVGTNGRVVNDVTIEGTNAEAIDDV